MWWKRGRGLQTGPGESSWHSFDNMPDSRANEFTPLLPAEEHSPGNDHVHIQNSTSTETRHFRQHRQSSGGGYRQQASTLLNRINRESIDEGISSAIDDEYDGEQLVRARSRLNSYPVLPEPESIKKKDEDTIQTVERVGSQDQGEAGDNDPADDPNSKYMRVGAFRFWLVFMTVLLGV